MTGVNGYKLSMTYQGAQPKSDAQTLGVAAIGSKDASGKAVESTASDQILDLSDATKLAAELTTQDLNNVKAIKVGNDYLAVPNGQVLKDMIAQLKNVCIDKAGKLRGDFKYIDFQAKLNPAAAKDQPASSSLVLNVVGPEPNDGIQSTDRNLDFKRRVGGMHLLQPGDNLMNVARALYGEGPDPKKAEGFVLQNAQRLANFNGFSDPSKIPAGKMIYLVNEKLLSEVSARPPVNTDIPEEPETPTVPGTDPALTPEPTQPTAPVDRGAELYTENPPTVDGFLKFIHSDAQSLFETYEKRADKPYWDGGKPGKGFLTTGVGHLVKPGETAVVLDPKTKRRVNLGKDKLTPTEINNLFYKDLKENAFAVVRDIKPEVLNQLNRNQLIALASLAFNIGPGSETRVVPGQRKAGFRHSPVAAALNGPGTLDEKLKKASDGLGRYIFSDGQRMNGLISRRLGERILLLRPDVKAGDIPGYDKPALQRFIAGLNAGAKAGAAEGGPTLPTVRTDDVWVSRPRRKK